MDIPLSPHTPENLVSGDGFSSPVPRQPACGIERVPQQCIIVTWSQKCNIGENPTIIIL